MTLSAIKGVLSQAKHGNPANVAIALTRDKDAVILADLRKKPQALSADLRRQAVSLGLALDSTSVRYGTASFDPDNDASLLTLTVNKDASGAMRPRLLERLKKAGFAKLDITVDSGLETEAPGAAPPPGAQPAPSPAAEAPQPPATEAAPPPAPEAPQPPVAGAAPPPTSEAPQAPATEAAPPPGAEAPQAPVTGAASPPRAEQPAADPAKLRASLTDLVKQLIALAVADPSAGNGLKAVAAKAQKELAAGDTAAAAKSISALDAALHEATAQPKAPHRPAVNVANMEKAGKAWAATRQKVEADIGKLRDKFADVFKDHEQAAALTAGFDARVEAVLHALDHELSNRLADVARTADPAEHQKAVADARQIIKRYEAFLATDPTVGEIDSNPLVPLAIQKTLTATLEVLSKAIA
jgi:hypothetical protein